MTVTSPGKLVAERLTAQLLSGRSARSPLDVVGHLLAVQAQDPRGARLTIRSWASGSHAADVDRALTDDRSMLVTWLNRGTLHLVRSEDYWWLHALTAPPVAQGNARRLAQEGLTADEADRGVAVIERALAADGALTRSQLRDRVAAAGVRVEGQALVHTLLLASLRGLVVRGPMIDGEQAFVLVRDWLGTPPPAIDRDVALAELARRYLSGHGPASDRDLAKWAGLPLGQARKGLAAIGSQLATCADGLVDLAGRPPPSPMPPPRLLGPFDPLLLGWVSRAMILGADQAIVAVNGVFRPFALAGGRAVATWSMVAGRVSLRPFGRLTRAVSSALAAEAADVERYLAPEEDG